MHGNDFAFVTVGWLNSHPKNELQSGLVFVTQVMFI